MMVLPRALAHQVKLSQYTRSGNAEYCTGWFQEVAEANGCTESASLLYFQEALQKEAENCGEANQVKVVFDALWAWFGLSFRKALRELSSLKRATATTLQEHTCQVERLVQVA